jgi:predicted transcriptional regulator of viral defense system
MKYSDLGKLLGQEGYFDLATVVQLTGERRESICIQLHRWCKDGKLLALRRGMYAFPAVGGMRAINPAELANRLYTPSYISTYWAMGYYGLIPEKVVTYTSVTSRVTRSFSNALGLFSYQSLKPDAFFGYRPVMMGDQKVLIAEPEKALLDLWYLEQGAWSHERMESMRFQNQEVIDEGKLHAYAERFQSPRLVKAVDTWTRVNRSQNEGTVEL